jgi:osmoprotectant transport system permease protein
MSFSQYLADRWSNILTLGFEHAQLVLIAVSIATVIGVSASIAVEHHAFARRAALTVTGAMLTVPSFALFGLLIPILGLGVAPAVTALTLYAIFPILRNGITGLESVPAEVEDAARGMGLSQFRRLVIVRMPLAWPVVLNGIRVATIMSIGIAAIGAAVSGPGLGNLIFQGLARLGGANALNDTLAGMLGIAILALLLDLAFVLISRFTTPRGIRG